MKQFNNRKFPSGFTPHLNAPFVRTRFNKARSEIPQCPDRKVVGAGFTLIQNLIIIGLIGILTIATFVLFDPVGQIQKASDNKRKSDLKDIQRALLQYYKDFGKFPPNPGNCLKDVNQCKLVRLDGTTVEWGDNFSPYLKTLPKDPSKNKTYIYYAKTDGQAYYLYASLDRGQDLKACNSGLACASLAVNGLNSAACGGVCNYGVSSWNVSP